MGDLVFLRELIRMPGYTGRSHDINHVFRRVNLASMFDCSVTRASAPCSPIAIAILLSLLGIKSRKSRTRDAKNSLPQTRRYVKSRNAFIHMDVSRGRFGSYRSAMGRVSSLSWQVSATLDIPDRPVNDVLLTRTKSVAHRGIRLRSSRSPTGAKS